MSNVALQLNNDLQERSKSLQINTMSNEERQIISLFDKHRFDITKKHPTSESFLYWEETPLMQRRCLTEISGKPKCGKGFMLCEMIAVVCGAQNSFMSNKKPFSGKILIIDTEQEEEDIDIFNMRINAIQKNDLRKDDPRITIIPIRRVLTDEEARKQKDGIKTLKVLECYIKATNPDIVVIDNIADFVGNINDQDFCPIFVDDLCTIASKYNCNITTVIHTNIGSKPDADVDVKARGALGSVLTIRCSCHINLNRKNDGDIEIKFPHTRRKAIKQHIMQIEDEFIKDSNGYLQKIAIPKIIDDTNLNPATAKTVRIEQIKSFLYDFLANGKTASQAEIHEAFKTKFKINALNTTKDYLIKCKDILNIEGTENQPKKISLKEGMLEFKDE